MRRRRYAAVAALLALALLVWLLVGRGAEPKWTVTVEAEQTSVTPWRDIRLTANVKPPDAVRHPEMWRYAWQADSSPVEGHQQKVAWRTGELGGHTLSVTVESPWGTKKTASVSVEVQETSFVSLTGMGPPPPAPVNSALPFEIADVWVEKDQVCQGEPSRIRVTARDKRGQEKWLTPLIDGNQGWESTFIAPLSPPGVRRVTVSLTDGRTKDGGTVSTYAYILVNDCVARWPLFLQAMSVPPDDDYIGFNARMFDGPAWQEWDRKGEGPSTVPRAKAASYKWTFGDGETATSTDGAIRHHYPREMDRPEERATVYAASVEAYDDGGNKMATGYATVQLVNRLKALKLEKGLLQLVAEQAPGAPELPDGSRYTDVTLVNIDAVETVRLTELGVRYTPCDADDAPETSVSLQSVFAETSIPPKGRVRGRLTISKTQAERLCWARARVAGESTPGSLKATGSFALDTGRSPGIPLSPEAQETMNKALALLGKRMDGQTGPVIVTNEEIRQLEDQGKIRAGS